jgi:indole-3-glycerol phosphate synthase
MIRRLQPGKSINLDILQYNIAVPDAEPRNILEKIVWHKEAEVDGWRDRVPLLQLRQQASNAPPVRDFLTAIDHSTPKPALIAEVKKASPSKGVIREDFDPTAIAQAYAAGGATCLSVLADTKFFQGSYDYIAAIRQAVDLPILCKEFVIYPYQIFLARSKGADAILLIAAVLSDRDLQYFVKIIQILGMTALVEVHTAEELHRVLKIEGVNLIGINNRNLEDFSVDLQTTETLLQPHRDTLQTRQIRVVSESGLYTPADLQRAQQAGANAVLIGESLVKQPDIQQATTQLLSNLDKS